MWERPDASPPILRPNDHREELSLTTERILVRFVNFRFPTKTEGWVGWIGPGLSRKMNEDKTVYTRFNRFDKMILIFAKTAKI